MLTDEQHEDDPGILFTLYDYDDKGNVIFRDLKPEDYKIPGPPMAEYKDGPAPKKEEKEEKADVEDTTTTTVQSSSTGVTQPLAAAMVNFMTLRATCYSRLQGVLFPVGWLD